jgi:HTH-type transcriptional regulator/antitoxin HipB
MRLGTPNDVGRTIRQRRRELGLDQATLAKRVGVSRQWIVEIEKGKPRAELGLVLRTFKVLGIALLVDDLTRDTPSVDIDAIVERHRGSLR